ncbi:hypothetical protein PQO03_17780 [Lentisphaera profundi]|uniref:General secretion pathway GspH domain-containing protein n=1 Tax=Lentisphaera profundi TaxID=1658616 RepID=A0ABY7W085_9BACT|nr:hypothetical protein [Lentisphaera profundi]WDE97678.1 hypothetical protein PQO03_17780 [Lentisphaera profundi]
MKCRKFSFLELIIVIVLLTVVLLVVLNRFGGTSPQEMRLRVDNQLQDIFIKARLRAQLLNEAVELRFSSQESGAVKAEFMDPENTEVNEENNGDEAEPNSALDVWLGESEYSLADFCKMSEQEDVFFTFYPDGEASGDVLQLQVQDFTYTINVDRLNSQVMIDVE